MKEHLYKIISDDLRRDIFAGRYSPGDRLPSENELAEKYATTRTTVRKSLQILETEGLTRPQRGKGCTVLPPAHSRYTLSFGENDEMFTEHYDKITISPSGPLLSEVMHMPVGSPFIAIRKILEKDGRPAAYEIRYIPYSKGSPSIEMEINYTEFPEMFQDRFVPVTLTTAMGILAVRPPEYVTKALGLEKDAVLLAVQRTVITENGEPIGHSVRYLSPELGALTAQSGFYTRTAREYIRLTPPPPEIIDK